MLVVAGETIVDMIEFKPNCFEAFTGGGPYNVAKASAKMGTSTGYFSPISTDSFGDQFETEMTKLDVLAISPRSQQPTGLAIVKKDENGHPSYSFYRDSSADRDIEIGALKQSFPNNAHAFYIGGLALADGDDATTWTQFLAGLECPIFVDPNIRPTFIKNRDSYLARLEQVYTHSHIVKLSDEAIDWIAPGVDAKEYLLQIMKQFGIKIGLLTAGPIGATAITAEGERFVKTPKVEVIDTVGAGDCFSAASLSFLMQSREIANTPSLDHLEDMLEYATIAAAINCTRAGANAPTDEEIKAFQR